MSSLYFFSHPENLAVVLSVLGARPVLTIALALGIAYLLVEIRRRRARRS